MLFFLLVCLLTLDCKFRKNKDLFCLVFSWKLELSLVYSLPYKQLWNKGINSFYNFKSISMESNSTALCYISRWIRVKDNSIIRKLPDLDNISTHFGGHSCKFSQCVLYQRPFENGVYWTIYELARTGPTVPRLASDSCCWTIVKIRLSWYNT